MSDAAFADGLDYRFEIPSVEGPDALRAVLEEAERREVPVRRVSQGSGVMMLTDDEISEMAAIGAEHGVEVSLFLGPRGAWAVGGQSLVTSATGGVAHGAASVEWCEAEARRACGLGIRSLLVADLGVLARLAELRAAGELPASLLLKTSVLLPCANPETARVLERLGAGTINVATDLSPAQLGPPPPPPAPPTSRRRRPPRGPPPARCRSTCTSRCRTTRAASCASTRCRRSCAPRLPCT